MMYRSGEAVTQCLSWFVKFFFFISLSLSFSLHAAVVFSEDYETDVSGWTISNGVWEVGLPSSGPVSCFGGGQCAATVLAGNYPASAYSRLVSPSVILPALSVDEEIHLRFQTWFSYSTYDAGYVQISVWDEVGGVWKAWETVGTAVADFSTWSLKDVDLTTYAGQTVRLGFYHVADRPAYTGTNESSGWYVDDIEIIAKLPEFTGDFEAGWVDWSAERGVWQVGTPTSGPASCYSGTQCAGTEIDGNYHAYTDSRMVSATYLLPPAVGAEEIHLRFQSWFSYSTYDAGYVQISVLDEATNVWQAWENVGSNVSGASSWVLNDSDVTAYAEKKVRLGFYHTADRPAYTGTNESTGWYIDDIIFATSTTTNFAPVLTPIIDVGVNENDTLTIPLLATDPNPADNFVLSFVGPAFVTLIDSHDGSGILTASPGFGDAGDHVITVTVTDFGGLTDRKTFILTVNDVGQAPSISAIANQNMNEGELRTLPITASDPDVGDTLGLAVSGPVFVKLVDNGNGTGELTITPSFTDSGNYPNVTVTVTDGSGLSVSSVFALTVNDVPPPVLDVSTTVLNLGDALVGGSTSGSIVLGNSGGSPLTISNITSSGAPFNVFSPTSLTIEPGGLSRTVSIGFSPSLSGAHAGMVTINHNAGADIVVNLTGNGVAASGLGNIDVVDSVEFGTVFSNSDSTQTIVVDNIGDGLLSINSISTDNSKFTVTPIAGELLPKLLNPGESLSISVAVTPDVADAGTTLSAVLTIGAFSDTVLLKTIDLTANVVSVPASTDNNTVAAARVKDFVNLVYDAITLTTCANVSGEVSFIDSSSSADSFRVTLTHQGGSSVTGTTVFPAPEGSGIVEFSGIDVCALPDGVFSVEVILLRGGVALPVATGKPAVKHTVMLNPPVLDILPPYTLLPAIDVCGTSQNDTTVVIEGGAYPVSIVLDDVTTNFCLLVPLRVNQQNTLIATAIDNLAVQPKSVASALPMDVIQISPQDVVIVGVESRPLTVAEIDDLVTRGIISLSDASNFNVSMFTIVLTIGGNPQPIRITQPFFTGTPGVHYPIVDPVSGEPGTWTPITSPSPIYPSEPGSGCKVSCFTPIIIEPENGGPIIPGVIIIDGRIKTLKEFFQVTLIVSNTSTIFDLSNMTANIDVPAGLTPINAGAGLNVDELNINGSVDTVDMGIILPGESGAGQFIIRGDAQGQYRLKLDFAGEITGGGLPVGIPVSGSASTTVEVFGPPELRLIVSHPSVVDGPDVSLGEIYDLLVSIQNVSDRPALYASLQLFVGGDAVLVDSEGNELTDSNKPVTFGHILPNGIVEYGFRVKSLVQGEIIACQAIAGENLILTIDTGSDPTACSIVNTFPANFEPLPANDAPVLIGINPLNGQPSIPITTSVVASFTPQTACLTADTWKNLVVEFIDPNDQTKGMKIVEADLDTRGTFYLEEMNENGEPLHHVPVDLTVVDPLAGGTSIAVLRLGLSAPLSEILLKPNTNYRVTVKGGQGGVCSKASGETMREDFVWHFSTVSSCEALEPPSVVMLDPTNNSIDRPLNQVIVLSFTNRDMNTGLDRPARMDELSIVENHGVIADSTFGAYKNPTIVAGDIEGGTPITGVISYSDDFSQLTFTPESGALSAGDTVVIRLTDQVKDGCSNPLQTQPYGVKLLSFQTVIPIQTQPVLTRIDDQIVNEGASLAIPISATDLNNDPLSFSTTGLPLFCSLTDNGNGTGVINCNPGYSDAGVYPVTVTVSDGALTDSDSFLLKVINVNRPPELSPIGPQGVDEGGSLTISLSATDLDGDPLTFSTTGLPAFCAFTDLSGGLAAIVCDPGFDDAGSYPITVTVSDGDLSDFELFVLTVNNINVAPIASGYELSTLEDTPVGLTLTASDRDGDPLTYMIVVAPSYGILSGIAPNLTYNPNANYFGSDSFSFKVNDGLLDSNIATISINVISVNDAPVAVDDLVFTDEDTTLAISATFLLANDYDVDDDTLILVSIGTVSNGTISLSADKTAITYIPNPDYFGEDFFTYTITDGLLTSTARVTINVNSINDAVELSADPSTQTVQYSDGILPVTISANDIDASILKFSTSWSQDGGVVNPGLPSGLIMDTSDCVGANSVSCTRTINGAANIGAGNYEITIDVDDGALAITIAVNIVVSPENAMVAFDDSNPVAVKVDTAGGSSGDFTLFAYVSETIPDAAAAIPYSGDIGLVEASMTLNPVGPGSSVAGTCVKGPVSGSGYEAMLTLTCSFSGVAVNTYTSDVTVDGNYYMGSGEDVVVVFDPSLGFTTGGGWFYWPGSANPVTGYPGDRTNFGYTMKYNKAATNVKGNLLLIRHMPDGSIYRVKSNAINGLAVGEDIVGGFGWASFSGKSTYKEPDWLDAVGNHEFIVYVEDHDEPGTGTDRFWVQIKDKSSLLIDAMSMPEPATDNSIYLVGGNIVAPHTNGR